jgi:type IV secretion system protein VirB4
MITEMPRNFDHANDQSLSSLVKWSTHLDENTLGSSDGSLMQIMQLTGRSTVGLADADLKVALENRVRALQAVNAPNLGICFYCVKRKIKTDHHNSVVGLEKYPLSLNAAIKPVLIDDAFAITWYACFILTPPLSKTLRIMGFIKSKLVKDMEADLVERIESLHVTTNKFIALQSGYKPRLLGLYKNDFDSLCSEPAQFLRYVSQHIWSDVPYSPANLNKRIASRRVVFEKSGVIKQGSTFSRNTNPVAFDQVLPSGCVSALLSSEFECHFSLCFRYILRGDAKAKIRLNIDQLRGMGDDGVSQMAAMEEALDQLAGGEICFTKSYMSITVFADSERAVNKNLQSVVARFSDTSLFTMSENTVTAKAVYLSTIPGNWEFAVRNTSGLHTGNIASMVDFANFSSGSLTSEWSDERPIFTTTTEFDTLYHFNLHSPNSDVPHSTITGQTGGGKTALLATIIAMSTRFDAKLFCLDIERGQEVFIRAMGGIYVVVEPGKRTGWNPFDLPQSNETASFVARLVESMLELSGVEIEPSDFNQIQGAVEAVFALPTNLRKLNQLSSYFPNGDNTRLADGLAQWVVEGPRAWCFDNESSDSLKFTNPYYGFDMTKLSEDKKVGAIIFGFLAYAADSYLVDGSPIVFALEEGWAWLESDIARGRMKHWYRTGRRNKIALVLATNNAAVISSSDLGKELAKQSPTNIFLASPRSKPEDYAAFDLTPSQIDRILLMTPEQRQFAIKQGNDFVVLNFNLSEAPAHLEVISGRKETMPLVDLCIADFGEDTEQWVPEFMRRAIAHREAARRKIL